MTGNHEASKKLLEAWEEFKNTANLQNLKQKLNKIKDIHINPTEKCFSTGEWQIEIDGNKLSLQRFKGTGYSYNTGLKYNVWTTEEVVEIIDDPIFFYERPHTTAPPNGRAI